MSPPSVLTPAGFARAAARLAADDPALKAIVDQHGMPGFWHRPPGFATLCLLIVEQQVSLASARAVFERVGKAVGGITPGNIGDAEPEVLGRAGLTRQKQRYLRGLADLVRAGELDLDALTELPDTEAKRLLLEVTGVGPWTADVYLLAALRRPDLWPVGDRALQVAVGESLGLDGTPTAGELDLIGEPWRPFRSVVARLMWHGYLARRGRSEPAVAELPEAATRPE